MSSEAAFDAERALLGGLAELSLRVAQDVQAAMAKAEDTAAFVRLAEAFTKVGRCLRMSIALSMRLAKGEALAPAREPRDPDLDLEADEPDDFDLDEERPEREALYDRLPSGDPATQIAAVARTLTSAVRILPAPVAEAYRLRCEALVANAATLDEPTRARGPPGFG